MTIDLSNAEPGLVKWMKDHYISIGRDQFLYMDFATSEGIDPTIASGNLTGALESAILFGIKHLEEFAQKLRVLVQEHMAAKWQDVKK